MDDEGGVESQHPPATAGLAVAYQLNVTHVMDVKSEVGIFRRDRTRQG
ncbi:MAG TPA: hypothetical protein VKB21_06755 [Candidatus Acidoferrum sp.]|nr:hypothetical protein [Candidatus Acidoferrum sp.]